ncbi:MAG: Fe-S cluster assembly protein SufD [Lysobacterales bacterium]
MSALLQSLGAAFEGNVPGRAAVDAALHGGLPNPRSEAWKYTSLRALERRNFVPATLSPDIDAKLLKNIPAPRLVFVNGAFDQALSDLGNFPGGVELSARGGAEAGTAERSASLSHADDVFARLNMALADHGAKLSVMAGTAVSASVHLVFVGAPAESDQAWHLRHDIALGAGSRLTLVEHHLASGEHAHFANAVTRIELGADAQLHHVRVQREAGAATSFLRTDAALAENAHYQRLDLELGAALSRHELNVQLDGDGAKLVANGVQLAQGRRHLDTRLGIEHLARATVCDLTWRGLAAGRGRVVFRGGITIQAGADGSDARLSTKNLLLSDTAEIDTQPVLEIHADEVKAAHGATVGRLDPTAMYYLRTRGLPEGEARRLLTAAFCREPLASFCSEGVHDEVLRQLLIEAVDTALSELPAE